uniref:Kinesin motor domain-containing protein n=1 Tax=Proboscia inermis TaxID=420281 RepID=A0A7S0GDK0_9STRA|mmetsp:Transcript_27872/g.28271  ORF Transcript_27872/g.28271 Transcript_27872/m.28271 type:complete len:122 (+) Transcript_27872:267-632(+)
MKPITGELDSELDKSLLVLKECLQSLSNVSVQLAPFRESQPTRLLQNSLAPNEKYTSLRNLETECVMLVNVSPYARLERGTLNSLRYGQKYGTRGKATPSSEGTQSFRYTSRPASPQTPSR